MTLKNRNLLHQTVYEEAMRRGQEASFACNPTPMHVVEHTNPLDDTSPVAKRYAPIADGVCGFAWVTVRPANCSFAKWLLSSHFAKVGYDGGAVIWISHYNQSMTRKEAHAEAMAAYLRQVGIKAHAGSRMD
jgi:hypothetical protein